MKREPCHSGEPSQMGEVSSDLWVKVNGALASTSWELSDLRVKVNGAFASTSWEVSWLVSESQRCTSKHVLRGKVTCERKSAVLLVDTSRVTQERSWHLNQCYDQSWRVTREPVLWSVMARDTWTSAIISHGDWHVNQCYHQSWRVAREPVVSSVMARDTWTSAMISHGAWHVNQCYDQSWRMFTL